ncbi:MAG: RAD55 family ATPase [Promethearchaeota archaeon]
MSEDTVAVTIGVSQIDEILGGGLRRGTTCLLEELGGESSGVTGIAGMAFLYEGIKRGDGSIVLLSEHTVHEYRNLPGTKRLLPIVKPGQFIFMDALTSMTFGEPTIDPKSLGEGVVQCTNVRYTAKFYEELRKIVNSFERPLLYIDSLSVLLHAMESDDVAWRFWLSLLPMIRNRNITVVASFYPEMHSHRFVESIERICDTIMQFTASVPTPGKENVRFIRVIKNRGLSFDGSIYPYTLNHFKLQLKKGTRKTKGQST